MTIRPAVVDDAYLLARLRAAMWDENHADAPASREHVEEAYTYWYEMLEQGRMVAWLAEEQGEAVGIAAMLLHRHPPLPISARRRGYVTAVYVVPAWRRKGIAQALMQTVIDFGRAQQLQRLELRPSDMARDLYAGLGFAPQPVWVLDVSEKQ